MSNQLIGFQNIFKTGGITSGSQISTLGPTNLALDQCSPSVGWQTFSGVVTSAGGATLTLTGATTGLTWRAFCLVNTNLTAAASVVFKLFTNPSTQVFTQTVAGPVPGYRQAVAFSATDVVADYLTIAIDDPTNPDDFINVGGAFAGPAWDPNTGITWDSAYGSTVVQSKVTSRGGQEFRTQLYRQRYYKLAMDSVRDTEAWSQLGELDRIAALGVNVLIIPNTASANVSQEAVFGPLDAQADVTYSAHSTDARAWRAQITERL